MQSGTSVITATAKVPVGPVGYRVRPVDLHWGVIAQLACCVVPAMGAVFLGKPLIGAQYMAASLFLLLGVHAVRRDQFTFVCLVVGALPAMLLLRGLFFYDSVIAALGSGCLLWFALSPQRLYKLWKDQAWRWMTFGLMVFWWLSVLQTGEYIANLRSFELILASGCVFLLAERRSYLATALVGAWMSTILLGTGLLPYGERLGQATIDNIRVGNPILLGMPSVLLVIVSLADGGRWMLLERKVVLRIVICLTAGEWLILSGSRGSWIAALTGLLMILLLSRKDRKTLLVTAGLVSLVAMLWLSTPRGQKIAAQFEKTMDSDRTLANRTSGRSVQWSVIPLVFAESPIWGWGPGTGKDVAWKYTGRHLGWHALYLQVLGETGLIGAALVLAFLICLLLRGIRHWRRFHEITPLAGIVTYMVIGASVSGLDAMSGVLVGLALLSEDVPLRLVLARARPLIRRAA